MKYFIVYFFYFLILKKILIHTNLDNFFYHQINRIFQKTTVAFYFYTIKYF